MDIIKVVCGIIYKDNKILLCRRKQNKSLGGYWEFPGGKVEVGENFENALCRELLEEIGMRVNVNDYFASNIYKYEKVTIDLIAYKCDFIDASYNMTDHDAYEWINENELINWKLAPADIPIARKLSR